MKSSPPNQASPKNRRRLRTALWLLAAYTLLGFAVLPLIIKAVATRQLAAQLDRPASIGSMRMNPYTLSLTVRDLLVKDPDGEPFLSFTEFHANFQLSSLLGKPWVFKEIRLAQPFVRVQVNQDRSLNFSDLLKKFTPTNSAPTAAKAPLMLEIAKLQIIGARAGFADLTPLTPFHRVIGPVEIMLTDFHTDPANRNPYSFTGTTESGEKFSWSGHFFLDPIRLEGDLALDGLSLAKYAPLYQDFVRFQIRDGVIETRSTLRFGFTATNYLASVTNTSFALKSLKLAAPGNDENLLELDTFSVTGVAADAVARTAEVGTVLVDGARMNARRATNATLNLMEAARPAETATNGPGGVLFVFQMVTNAFAELWRSTNLWSATIHELDVTNGEFSWQDLANRRPVNVSVDEFALTARHLSNLATSNLTARLSFRWNTNGLVRMDTTLQGAARAAEVTIGLTNLELHPLDPYLEPFLNLYLLGSKIGLQAQLQMRMDTNDVPHATLHGDLRLDDFSTVDGVMAQDLVKWDSLRLTGLEATLSPPAVSVQEIALIAPHAHVTIETNRLLNLLNALKLGDTNAAGADLKNTTAPVPVVAPVKKIGLAQRFGNILRETLTSNTNAAGAMQLPKITVGAVVLSNAVVQFDDRSSQPAVKFSLEELNGLVTGISSEELKRADVHLTGRMNRTGTLELTGKINPLNQDAPTELKVVVKDVDLSPASPYAGRFLGSRLNRGKLNLEVDYRVSEHQLKAQNVLLLDQLTLGEKVDSPDATKLPVRLAIAVLKDRNGRIELDVPIEGRLDDPEFRLGKVITRTIVNILTKIVTSPFSMLGAVFGGKGEELSYLEFNPGSFEVPTNQIAKLDTLVNGLVERPGLQLEIEGCADPATDGHELRRQKLLREFRLQKWEQLRQSAQSNLNPDQVTLTGEEQFSYLQRAYGEWLKSQVGGTNLVAATANSVPVKVEPARNETPAPSASTVKGAQALMQPKADLAPFSVNEMEAALLAKITVTDEELRDLASERARNLQQLIVATGKIEPARLFLADTSAPTTNYASKVFFHLR